MAAFAIPPSCRWLCLCLVFVFVFVFVSPFPIGWRLWAIQTGLLDTRVVSQVTPIAVLAFVIVLREIFTNISIGDLVILKAGDCAQRVWNCWKYIVPADSKPRHTTDFRTVFGLHIGQISSYNLRWWQCKFYLIITVSISRPGFLYPQIIPTAKGFKWHLIASHTSCHQDNMGLLFCWE